MSMIRALTLAAALCCVASGPLVAQVAPHVQELDPTGVRNILDSLQAREAEFARQRQELERAAAEARQELESRTRNVDSLRASVQKLENARMQDSILRERELRADYEEGKRVLSEISIGLSAISSMEGLLAIEQQLNLDTNLWGDADLKNVWDWVSDGGAVLAAGFSLFALTSDDEDVRTERFAIGASSFGVSRLLSMILGGGGRTKIAEKARFIELSNMAFNDVRGRVDMVNAYLTRNREFRNNFEKFRVRYERELANDPAAALIELGTYMDQFTGILGQIPELLGSYRSTITRYTTFIEDPAEEAARGNSDLRAAHRELVSKMTRITLSVDAVEKEYRDNFLTYFSTYTRIKGKLLDH